MFSRRQYIQDRVAVQLVDLGGGTCYQCTGHGPVLQCGWRPGQWLSSCRATAGAAAAAAAAEVESEFKFRTGLECGGRAAGGGAARPAPSVWSRRRTVRTSAATVTHSQCAAATPSTGPSHQSFSRDLTEFPVSSSSSGSGVTLGLRDTKHISCTEIIFQYCQQSAVQSSVEFLDV